MPGPTGDWANFKAQARREIHGAFGVSAEYADNEHGQSTTWFTVRWSKRLIRQGELAGGEYAGITENVNKIIFSVDEIAAAVVDDQGRTWGGFPPKRGGILYMPDYGVSVTLDNLDKSDGPVNVVWNVTDGVGL